MLGPRKTKSRDASPPPASHGVVNVVNAIYSRLRTIKWDGTYGL